MKLLGVSGSPITNSNTDRAVLEVLKSSGLDYDFVKLSQVNIRPCMACKACAVDNVCKVKDDFQAVAEKLTQAEGLVIGGYIPYGMIDGFTKAFLERLWSLRHKSSLNEGKYVVSIISGLVPQSIETAQQMIATEMLMERTTLVKQINIQGNVPCLTCGYGNECKNSAVSMVFGEGAKASPDKCKAVEDMSEWNSLKETGMLLEKYIKGETELQI